MTYTCTVAWCPFDGRTEAALRKHVRTAHPWLAARERQDALRADIDTAHRSGRSWSSIRRA